MHFSRRLFGWLGVLLLILSAAGALGRLAAAPLPAQGAGGGPHLLPTLQLFVTSRDTNSILRYDGSSGAFVDAFVPPGSGGINRTYGLRFAPDGSLLASSSVTHEIKRYDGVTGAFLNNFVPAGGGGWSVLPGCFMGRTATCMSPAWTTTR